MTTLYIEDQPGGVSLVLRDQDEPPYYPAATVGAARVEVWTRNRDKGVDSAIKVGEFKPGGEVDFNVGALGSRDLLVATVSYSGSNIPSVSDLNHADWREINFTPSSATAAGFDEHVPTVTLAPTIAKAPNSDEWIVFTPAPDEYGATLTGVDIHVEKASDSSVFEVWQMLAAGSSHRIDQKAYPCKIKYRWRNQSAEDAGDGRGVSAWSPQAAAAEIGGTPNPAPSTVLTTFDPDPEDSRAGVHKVVLD